MSTIDGCPLGVMCGPRAGYAGFEVVYGGLTVSTCNGDSTMSNVSMGESLAVSIDEEPVWCKVERVGLW